MRQVSASFMPHIPPSLWLSHNTVYFPNKLALITLDRTWTYAELATYVNILATQLLHYGIVPHTAVAISCNSKFLSTALLHALPTIGCAAFPLREDRSNFFSPLLITANVKYIITDTMVSNETQLPVIQISKLPAMVTIKNQFASTHALELNDIHLLIATSGSTGIPKAVMLTGNNIVAAATASLTSIPLMSSDRWLLCLPLYHIGGVAILHRCTQIGAAVMMIDNADGATIANALAKYACTHVSLVPAMLARLLEIMPNPPPHLKLVLIGGAALEPSLAQRAVAQKWPLCISYGMSETCSQLASLCNPASNWSGQLVGKPLPGMQIRIEHITGRIQVRGNMLMAGYANSKGYLGVGIEEDGWFTTADVGSIDTSGQLWVQGRADYVLNSGGIKIYPEQVECILKDCPGINEVAISGRYDPIWGELVVAIFVGTAEICAIEAWCRQHIHSSIRPRSVIKVKTLPRTTIEKLDRAALRVMANN